MPEAERQRQRALYPVAPGAPEQKEINCIKLGLYPLSFYHPDHAGHSAQWKKLSSHIAPCLSLVTLGEHPEVKGPVGHRSVFWIWRWEFTV